MKAKIQVCANPKKVRVTVENFSEYSHLPKYLLRPMTDLGFEIKRDDEVFIIDKPLSFDVEAKGAVTLTLNLTLPKDIKDDIRDHSTRCASRFGNDVLPQLKDAFELLICLSEEVNPEHQAYVKDFMKASRKRVMKKVLANAV